jgi:hypothetical protein
MHAIEFNATIRNGVIEVPEPYKSRFTQPVRVLLLSTEETQPYTDTIERLLEHPLVADRFTPFTREQAHERG